MNDLLPRDEDDLRGVIGVQHASEQSDLIVVGLQEVGECLCQSTLLTLEIFAIRV